MECGGGADQAAERAACGTGSDNHRLERGTELRRGGGADSVSCALAFDSQAAGGLRETAGWSAWGDCGEADVLKSGVLTSPSSFMKAPASYTK